MGHDELPKCEPRLGGPLTEFAHPDEGAPCPPVARRHLPLSEGRRNRFKSQIDVLRTSRTATLDASVEQESAPTRVVSGRTGVRAKAAIPLRARHRRAVAPRLGSLADR
jgi:hypothetical protein